ncbi:hypothetical protein [Halomonas sp. I5-271120]|uniref:hypothetical protein n=1 Tax=Halomonas sp. I5-271120 TaxID=3061632 RepID=UPI0027149B1A|nr:hypothetical protein [Halomonas sp. I5-271120]
MAVSFTQKRLYRVGSRPLDRDANEVTRLAEAVWYRNYRPRQEELERLRDVMPREEFQRTLCVLEILSLYPVCRRDTAKHLQALTRRFHRQLLGGDDAPVKGRYSPSKRWGLPDTTNLVRKALLPLQTRAYADSTERRHGLSV